MASPSYSHGVSTQPLLGDTIGQNLARTVARVPGHEALVSVQQDVRLTYRELLDAVDRIATGPARARRRGRRPGRRLVAQLRGVGARSSTPPHASARSSSTSTRRTARTS